MVGLSTFGGSKRPVPIVSVPTKNVPAALDAAEPGDRTVFKPDRKPSEDNVDVGMELFRHLILVLALV